jgi:uncharacterized membrane protein YfcA
MQTLNRPAELGGPPGLERLGSPIGAAAGALAAIAGFAAAFVLLPPVLVFPVTATGLMLAAVALAIIAWASPAEIGRSRRVFWQTAGALTLIGLCAALFGEAEQVVALIDRDR